MSDQTLKAKIQIDAYVNEAQAELANFKKSMDEAWQHSQPPKTMLKEYESLRLKIASLQKLTEKGVINSSELSRATSDYNTISKEIHNLSVEYKLVSDAQKQAMLDPKVRESIAAQEAAVKAYNNTLKKNQEELKRKAALEEEQNKVKKSNSGKKGTITKLEKQKKAVAAPVPNDEAKKYLANQERLKQVLADIETTQKNIHKMSMGGKQDTKTYQNATDYLDKLKEEEALLREGEASYNEYAKAVQEYEDKIAPLQAKIDALNKEIEEGENKIKDYQKQIGKIKVTDQTAALGELKNSLKQLGVSGLDGAESLDDVLEVLDELSSSALAEVDAKLDSGANSLENMAQAANKMKTGIDGANDSLNEQNKQLEKMKDFGDRIKQFLGLAGAIEVLKRAARSAFESVSELDKVMTDMAVVTDLKVGDYWKQLPEHTERANELGVAIKDVYEAETLYYQQGLKSNEVTAMSTQTLKMARIAGLSAADATDKMTAALRGFNMELDETSAQRVADVYSELAAITAADVDEISSAMSKTASIASSAGMEFETTAAFLSQIIETTRESAETAGTALKTVIARFQELKKDPADIGEVDGEIVDANQIETALRSVGVSLRDASGQFRDLDDVFMELAQKWNTLDTNTQRYIATIAAGSRQQSRFIAMMSDYGRTQELVTAANTSAGASQKQYEKTLDSLESKLNELKNAWAEFTMGIMNSDFLKAGVDILTKLLTIINKVTQGFGTFTGIFSKLGVIVAVLKVGEALITKIMTSLSNKAIRFGKTLGNSIAEGIAEGMKQGEAEVNESQKRMQQNAENNKNPQSNPQEPNNQQPENTPQNNLPALPPGSSVVPANNQAMEESKGPPINLDADFAKMREQQAQQAQETQPSTFKGKLQQKTTAIKNAIPGVSQIVEADHEQKEIIRESNKTQLFSQAEKGAGLGQTLSNANMGKEVDGKKMAAQAFPDSMWKEVEKQYKTKMQAMGKNTEEIEKSWNKTAANINKKGVKAVNVIEDLDKELVDAADTAKQDGKEIPDSMKQIEVQGDEACQSTEDLENQMNETTQKSAEGMKSLASGVTNAGLAITGAGLAFGAMGSVFESMGLDGVAEGFNTVGTVLTTVGGIVTAVGGVMTFLNAIMAGGTIASLAQSAANVAQSGSWLGVAISAIVAQTAMSPLLVITLMIVAAIIALVAIVLILVAVFNAIKNSTPEAKLEKAQEAAEAAGEAAEQAAEAYRNLEAAFESLSDKYDALDELTEGTREWRDAVKEINSEVMELVDQYPELAALVTNEDGVLKIDIESDDAQAVLDQYEGQAMKASSAEIAAKMSVLEAQTAVDRKHLSDEATVQNEALIGWTRGLSIANLVLSGGVSAATSTAGLVAAEAMETQGEKDTDALAQALAEGLVMEQADGSWKATAGSEERLAELGLSADEAEDFANALGEGTDELKEYGEALSERAAQEKAMYEAMALNAVQMVDTAGMEAEQITQVNVAANEDYMKHFTQELEAEYANWDNEQIEAKAKELYGEDATVNKDGSVTVGEGDDATEISKEAFIKQAAAADGTEAAAEALEDLPKAIDSVAQKMGKSGKSFEKSYMAEDGKALTKKDIANLKGYDDAELQAIWDDLSEEEQNAFGSLELFKQHIADSVELSEKAFENATKTLNEMGATVQLHEDMTAEAAAGYAKQLENVAAGGGQANVNMVDGALDALANTMGEEDLNKFMGQLNAMDWKNMDAWDNLPETLEKVGLSAYANSKELQAFIAAASESAGAIRNIDLDKLNEQMQSLQNISSKIKSGEQGRTFDSSSYEALIEAIPDMAGQFQQTLEGDYVFLGSAMSELTLAIQENTDALLQQATEQLQNKIDAAETMERMTKSWWTNGTDDTLDDIFLNIKNWKSWENDESGGSSAKSYLKYFIQEAEEDGVDLKQLGIAGLTNYTDVESLTDEQIKNMMDQLQGIYNDLEDNRKTVEEKLISSYALTYQNRDTTSNSLEATKYRNVIANGGSLEEDEQMQFEASVRATTAQAVSVGINSQDINNYTEAANEMKKLQEEFEAGNISADKFKKQYEALATEVEEFERIVTNKTNLKKMNSNLQNSMSKIAELGESLDKVADEATKMEMVSSMVSGFGIEVDASNYEEISKLAIALSQGGEDAKSAMNELVALSGQEFGLSMEEITTMTHTTYTDTTYQMSKEMQEFTDKMIASGMGMWQELEDGSKRFAFSTAENLKDAAELAGTTMEEWELSYGMMNNYSEQVNRTIREREQLEREYNNILKDENITAKKLLENQEKKLASLKEQADYEVAAIAEGYGKIETMMTDPKYAEFAKYTKYDAKTQTFTDDAAGLTEEKREEYEAWRAELDESNQMVKDAKDSLYDIRDQVDEMAEESKQAISDLYDAIREGLVLERQQQIDELQNINDSIQSAENALIGKIQEQINEARQERDMKQAEEDLGDRLSYLSYLQGDSSGANELEALMLQEEVRQSKEDLMEAKIDQSIANMQEASAEAAEQRQHQIDIAQQQLDIYSTSAEIWTDVQTILNESLLHASAADDWAAAWQNTEAFRLASDALGSKELNPIKQAELKQTLGTQGASASIYSELANMADNVGIEIDALINGVGKTEGMIDIIGNYLISSKPESLVSHMTENTSALVSAIMGPEKEAATKIMETMATHHWTGDMGSGYKANIDILNWRTWKDDASESSIAGYLKFLQDDSKAAGFDLSSLGISNLSNDSDISSLNDKQLEEIMVKLESIYKSQKNLFNKPTGQISDIEGYVSLDQHNQNVALKKIKEEGKTLYNELISKTDGARKQQVQTAYNNLVAATSTDVASVHLNTLKDIKKQIADEAEAAKKAAAAASKKRWTSYQDAADAGYSNILGASRSEQGRAGKTEAAKKYGGGYQGYLDAMYEKYMGEAPEIPSSSSSSSSSSKNSAASAIIGYVTEEAGGWKRSVGDTNYQKNIKTHNGATYYKFLHPDGQYRYLKKGEGYYWYNDKGGSGSVEYVSGAPIYSEDIFKYKQGGLADFTGPAWLDGTKAQPEMVLNARDTANFIQLKDILSEILTGTRTIQGNNTQSAQTSTFDIDINVEKIEDDYDVEQLANKIRSMLYDDASYRNVNDVSRMR